MLDFLFRLFQSDAFVPRSFCIANPHIVHWLIFGDALTTLAYFVIPVLLVYFLRKKTRYEQVSRWTKMLVIPFAVFILSCGVTHLLDILIMWWPMYRLDAVVKLVTGISSVATAVLLWHLGKGFLRMPWTESYKMMLREVQQRQQEFEALAENSPVVMFRADSSGRISYINGTWEEQTGYSVADVLAGGHVAFSAIHPDERAEALRRWYSYVKNPVGRFDVEYRIVHKTSWRTSWLRIIAQNIDAPEGRTFIGMAMDITERREREAYKQVLIDAITENASDAVFVTDANCEVTFANRASEEMFGWDRQELVGRSLHDAIHYKTQNGLALASSDCVIDNSIRRGTRIRLRYDSCVRKNGEFLEVAISVTPFLVKGKLAGAVLILRDVTERKKFEQEILRNNEILQHVNQALQRSNDDLKQFAYAASHDLQEPLRSIGGFTQLLIRKYRGKLDGEADDIMRYVTDSVRRMEAMIRDLLQYSRIESRADNFELINLSDCFNVAVDNIRVLTDETQAKITSDIRMPSVMGDCMQITRVFQNLLVNAINFRRENMTPEIHVSVTEDDPYYWRVSVRDNGVGIEPKYYDRIFQMFKRLSVDSATGTGIGLPMCRKIVHRHGGRMWVESTPGVGSIFYFTLPKIEMPADVDLNQLHADRQMVA